MPVPTQHMHVAAERVGGVGDGVTVPVAVAFGQDELERCQRSADEV